MSATASAAPLSLSEHTDRIDELREVGRIFWERKWSLGTSSNYSTLLSREPQQLLITASGRDKRKLSREEFVIVGDQGQALDPSFSKPSAETLLHVVATQQPGVGAVLHTHSVWATILSDYYGSRGSVPIAGYEMLKGLAGITTHESAFDLTIFENTQDMVALSKVVRARFADAANPLKYGFLLRQHGLYTWGRDLAEAFRHVEIIEFLLEVIGRRLSLPASPTA